MSGTPACRCLRVLITLTLLVGGLLPPSAATLSATAQPVGAVPSQRMALLATDSPPDEPADDPVPSPAGMDGIAARDGSLIAPVSHLGGAVTAGMVHDGHAYLVQGAGVAVLDTSWPTPRQVAYLELPVMPDDMFISGELLYAVGGRFLVVDISDPLQPVLLSSLETVGGRSLFVAGDYAYAFGNMGLQTVDVSVPEAPVPVGPRLPMQGMDVFVSGRYAYALA